MIENVLKIVLESKLKRQNKKPKIVIIISAFSPRCDGTEVYSRYREITNLLVWPFLSCTLVPCFCGKVTPLSSVISYCSADI